MTPTRPFHPFVPRVIRAFRETFPLVQVKLKEGISNELIEHLQKERMDAAFILVTITESERLVYPLLGTIDGSHP